MVEFIQRNVASLVMSLTLSIMIISMNKCWATPAELQQMFAKIEQDTYTFAHAMEEIILNKCDFTSDASCYKASYHDCDSELPSAECPEEYIITQCGAGGIGGCGGLFDFTASSVRVAPDLVGFYDSFVEPENDRIRDGVCTTLQMDKYMKDETEASKLYWGSYQVSPPWFHMGTDEGIFRIFPGRPGKCPNQINTYDPRVRPWYVAASSGPKDIILVLDTSGSMQDYGRLGIMKDAAKRVINTLGTSDYFQVIGFSTDAYMLDTDNLLIRATAENKQKYTALIDEMFANGGTYFLPGFEMAFTTFRLSRMQDRSSECHRAILFLSDGELFDDEKILYTKLQTERAVYTDNNESAPVLFTYSLGSGADDRVLEEIACQNDGIWAKIADGGDLARKMAAYYKYFAYGLGDEVNKNFVAWVEPYTFATGVGMGITASAPVFDRTVVPPILAGVVGLDLSLSALERAFGDDLSDTTRDTVIQKVIDRSVAVCPVIELTSCQLESLRSYGSDDNNGSNRLCGTCKNGTVASLQSPLCENYAHDLWDNEINKGRNYTERTCCNIGAEPREKGTFTLEEIREEHMCTYEGMDKDSSNSSAMALIIALPLGISAGIALIVIVIIRNKRKKEEWTSQTNEVVTAVPATSPWYPVPLKE